MTLTYPHIGNTGCNDEDAESGRIHKVWANGLIIRDLPLLHSNFRSEQSLGDYLKQHNVVAIADIDTRKLTRILREKVRKTAVSLRATILQKNKRSKKHVPLVV